MAYVSQPKTRLNFFCYIKKTKVIILIDSGSLHNFIYTRIKKLNMFIYATFNFPVTILGDKTASCNGKCHKVELSINDYKLRSHVSSIAIGGVDVVLGPQWLASVKVLPEFPYFWVLRS